MPTYLQTYYLDLSVCFNVNWWWSNSLPNPRSRIMSLGHCILFIFSQVR